MKQFSLGRLLRNLLVLVVSVFLLISSYQQLSSFARVSGVKVETAKQAYYPIYRPAYGTSFFISFPVQSPSSGKLERLVGNFTFVSKGELVGRIKSEYSYDILAPENGVLLWGSFNKYFKSLKEIESFSGDLTFNRTSDKVELNEIVCSILNNDYAIIRINDPLLIKSSRAIFFVEGNFAYGNEVFSSNDYAFLRVNEFLKYFINRGSFELFEGFQKGIKINKSVLAIKNKSKGIFIVDGNVIKFVPVKTFDSDENSVIAVLSKSYPPDSVVVITTPHLVNDGQVFNE
jgi:hypothetical protein